MKYRWSIASPQSDLAKLLAKDLKISPLLAQCLLNRGLTDPQQIAHFIEPRLKNLADPFLLPGMHKAVDRLYDARARKEPLVIFGDYDVDGVTATALLIEVLRSLDWTVEPYLPHRMDEGYGLTQGAVENCLKKFPARLLLAVDCGSTSIEPIDWMQQQGVDVIVLDHHQLSEPVPAALALINPRCANGSSNGAFTELCSAGLAFKLAHALLKRGRDLGLPQAQQFDVRLCLDLVALGTIADLVPLTRENRILVNSGLDRLNQTHRPGLQALKQVAGITRTIRAHEVGFQFGPRLNAAGRLETAHDALHLLLAPGMAEALPLARGLDAQNRERQEIERKIAAEVVAKVRTSFKPAEDFVVVAGDPAWHIGVVGIVASRVLQEFYRPTIILGGDGEVWRGSGRSVDGFDIAGALRQCSDLLLRHGGHTMAAGITIAPANLEAFRARFNELARQALKPEHLQPRLRVDAEVVGAELTLEQLNQLKKLEHTGMGNPPVQLVWRNLTHQRPARRMGAENQHAKLWVTDGRTTHQAIIWSLGEKPLPDARFDLAFIPQRNEYNGSESVQLNVLDWCPS